MSGNINMHLPLPSVARSLIRRIVGAATGALVALGLYGIYHVLPIHDLTARILPSTTHAEPDPQEMIDHITERTRTILERNGIPTARP